MPPKATTLLYSAHCVDCVDCVESRQMPFDWGFGREYSMVGREVYTTPPLCDWHWQRREVQLVQVRQYMGKGRR